MWALCRETSAESRSGDRSLGLLFGIGGCLGLVAIGLHRGALDVPGEVALTLCAFPIAAGLFVFAGRLPRFVAPLLLGVGSVIVGLGITFGHRGPLAPVSGFFYIWMALFAFQHLPRRLAAAQLAWSGATYAAALLLSGLPDGAGLWLVTMGTAATVGAVVSSGVAQLRLAARRDHLTGIGNRAALAEALSAVAGEGSSRRRFSVVVLDLDGLKTVNDREGHAAGDALLRTAASSWRSSLRDRDMLFRSGGDEFVALLPGAGPEEAEAAAARLVAAGPPASAGAATWAQGDTGDSLLARADSALYRAKARADRQAGLALLRAVEADGAA